MWYLLAALWIVRGGTMADAQQPTVATAPPVVKPARTIADVEAELMLSAANVAYERAKWARKWPSRTTQNLADDTLDYVRRHNALLDEWAWWRYDDGPVVTRTGGPSTRVNG